MTVSKAVRHAIDSGSQINAEGCYLLALSVEEATPDKWDRIVTEHPEVIDPHHTEAA